MVIRRVSAALPIRLLRTLQLLSAWRAVRTKRVMRSQRRAGGSSHNRCRTPTWRKDSTASRCSFHSGPIEDEDVGAVGSKIPASIAFNRMHIHVSSRMSGTCGRFLQISNDGLNSATIM
eukprot:16230005-Heterocapsa_arctica.AAC.1